MRTLALTVGKERIVYNSNIDYIHELVDSIIIALTELELETNFCDDAVLSLEQAAILARNGFDLRDINLTDTHTEFSLTDDNMLAIIQFLINFGGKAQNHFIDQLTPVSEYNTTLLPLRIEMYD